MTFEGEVFMRRVLMTCRYVVSGATRFRVGRRALPKLAALAVSVTIVVGGCAPDPIAVAISEFDAAEVQEVRDHLGRAGDYREESVLSILAMERGCREIRSSLADLASGEPLEDAADFLDDLLVEQNRALRPSSAEYFQRVVDELRAGSSVRLQGYLDSNCENVE